MVFNLGDTVLPSLFTYVTAMVLSILNRTVMLFLSPLETKGHLFVSLRKMLPNLELRHLILSPERVSLS